MPQTQDTLQPHPESSHILEPEDSDSESLQPDDSVDDNNEFEFTKSTSTEENILRIGDCDPFDENVIM